MTNMKKNNRREYPYKRLRYNVKEALEYYDSEVISCLHLGKTPKPLRWTIFFCRYGNIKNPYNGKSLLEYMVQSDPDLFFKYVEAWYCMPKSYHKKKDTGIQLCRRLVKLIMTNARLDMQNDILDEQLKELKSKIKYYEDVRLSTER